MNTEKADSRYKGIDEWPGDQVLLAILAAQEQSVASIRKVIPALAHAAEDAALRLKAPKGRIIYVGAGTSARLGVQDGTELTPTFGWPRLRMAFVIAGQEQALTQAIEGAEDDPKAAEDAIAALNLTPADVCICVAASGVTPFTLAACKAARAVGAMTVGIANNPATPLLSAAEHAIFLDSGPEPVAGSTRMNAGTAQKVALNMLSTLIMIRLGHVYDALMVDVKLTNAKLHKRAERMVTDIAGCSPEDAKKALDDSGGNVKLAVLLTLGLTPAEGRTCLDRSEGNLRKALKSLKP